MLAWRCSVSLAGIQIAAPVPIVDGFDRARGRLHSMGRAAGPEKLR